MYVASVPSVLVLLHDTFCVYMCEDAVGPAPVAAASAGFCSDVAPAERAVSSLLKCVSEASSCH